MENVQNPKFLDKIKSVKTNSDGTAKKSRFSPTVKGAMLGAVAGNILPVFGTFSGALLGGIAGKIYSRRYKSAKKAD